MSDARLKFKPKFDKIVEALLYIAHRKPGVDHYHACKLIYLADREHLNRYGRPMAADRHLAMQWGPVASKALELLKRERKALAEAGIEDLPFETEVLDRVIHIAGPRRAVNKELFSRSDLRVLDEVIDGYAHRPFTELHDLTAEHFAYRRAWGEKPEGAKQAEMSYDDILDERADKDAIIEDLAPVSRYMR